ncbi:Neutral cholesterol ester hydrolase 1, partial [Trichinella pseudospiralis]
LSSIQKEGLFPFSLAFLFCSLTNSPFGKMTVSFARCHRPGFFLSTPGPRFPVNSTVEFGSQQLKPCSMLSAKVLQMLIIGYALVADGLLLLHDRQAYAFYENFSSFRKPYDKMLSRRFAIIFALTCLFAYWFHRPLPNRLADRNVLQIVEPLIRIVYVFPVTHFSIKKVILQFSVIAFEFQIKILSYFGSDWQIYWARKSLHTLARLNSWVHSMSSDVESFDSQFDGVPVRIYIPKTLHSDGALVFIHGGGFVLFDVDTYDALTRDLASETGMVTVSINYRLAPENIFPAAVEDCERALVHFLREGYQALRVNPLKVALIGDSAGGNLVAVTTQRLQRFHDLPSLKLQVLIYPFLQLLDLKTPSYRTALNEYAGTALLEPESLARYILIYLGLDTKHTEALLKNSHRSLVDRYGEQYGYISHSHLPKSFALEAFSNIESCAQDESLAALMEPYIFDPNFSPLLSENLTNLPPALIVTCEYDILRDEGFFYAKRLKEHNVDVFWWHLENGFHGMFNMHRLLSLAREQLTEMSAFIRAMTGNSKAESEASTIAMSRFTLTDQLHNKSPRQVEQSI